MIKIEPDGWAVGDQYFPSDTTHLGAIRFGSMYPRTDRYTYEQIEELQADIARLTAERDSLKALVLEWAERGWSRDREARSLAVQEQLAGYDIMGLAEEQRSNPGPFSGPGTFKSF